MDMGSGEFEGWYEEHRSRCQVNYTRSLNAMEVEGVE